MVRYLLTVFRLLFTFEVPPKYKIPDPSDRKVRLAVVLVGTEGSTRVRPDYGM